MLAYDTVTGGFEDLTSIAGTPPDLIDLPPGCKFHIRCPFATERCREEEPDLIHIGTEHAAACFYWREVEQQADVVKGPQACDWTTRYRSVVGYGTMEILTDGKSKQEGLEVIMAQHGAPELDAFDAKNLKRMVILKLRITSLSGKQSSNWDHTF